MKTKEIERHLSEAKPEAYFTFFDGKLFVNSFGCGCCSYGNDIPDGEESVEIDSLIKVHQQSISHLKRAKNLIKALNEQGGG